MNKTELIQTLIDSENNFGLCLASMTLLANKKVYDILEISRVKTSIFEFKMHEIVSALKDETSKNRLLEKYFQMSFRAFVTEFLEKTKEYCNQTGQWMKMQEQPWFHYSRLVRNCFAHNDRFKFTSKDKKILPVTFKDATITLEMDGQEIPLPICNHNHAYLLFNEVLQFVLSLD